MKNFTKKLKAIRIACQLGALGLAIGPLSQHQAYAADTVTLKVAYPSDFEPATPQAGKAWWDDVIHQFESTHPGVKVQLIQIPGGFSDSENKIALLFRSKSSAPDVVGLSDLNLAQWISSGYLLPIDKYLKSAPWWAAFDPHLKASETINGKVYAVSEGNNVYGILYDKTLFAKAGISMPWQPKSWNDILEAAKKLKAAVPGVYPLWITTGTTQGTFGALAGPGNFLAGSTDPTILTKNGKWVVDSKGLRETVKFYKDAAAAGVLAPTSQLLDTNAQATPPTIMPQHKIGIALSGNWYPDQWTKTLNAPYWADASKDIGVAPLPTINGQGPGSATTIGGWTVAIGSASKHPDLAWDLVNLIQDRKNMLSADEAIALVAPVPEYTKDPAYLNFAPPYRAEFAKISMHATPVPSDPNFSIWAQGLLTATQAVVVNPNTSVDDALQKMKEYVTNQVGPDSVVSLH
jgi:multiple sugar transport system substrate-binding protein